MPVAKGTRPPAAGIGRVKGNPNKFTREIKEAILNAFNEVGGEKYLVIVARKYPKVFCALLGRVLPLQISGELVTRTVNELSDAELARIASEGASQSPREELH